MLPKVSVITVNLNNYLGLRKTMESVLAQKYSNIEYIVIDGNSSDRSVEEIRTVESRLKYWVSEPDKGIYNAMNKGLQKASGDFVFFLNSADYLYDDDVIANLLGKHANEDIIYGNICLSKAGKVLIQKSPSEVFYHKSYQHNLPPHPAILIRRDLVNSMGGFDERYKIIADVVLIAKLFINEKINYKFVDIPVTVFDTNGVSSSKESQNRIYKERHKFILEEFPHYINDFEKVYKIRLIQKVTSRSYNIYKGVRKFLLSLITKKL